MEAVMGRRCWYEDALPFTALFAAECASVGTNKLYKAAALKGLSFFVYVVYSYAMAAVVLFPFYFFFDRRPELPSLNFPLIFRICLLGLIGVSNRLLLFMGIKYGSPTLSSAMSNLVPAFTFILAVIFRMERVAIRNFSTQAKIIGTLLSISGALVVVLYKGPEVLSIAAPKLFVWLQWPFNSSESDWIFSGFLLASDKLLLSIWYIIQAQVINMYPAEITVTFFYKLCATIISAPVCFLAERNNNSWRLETEGALSAVIYEGIFGLSLNSVIHIWGLRLKGPVYIATFRPFSIAIAAFMSFIFLGEALHLGSIIGAIIISAGFYALIWGKAKETKTTLGCGSSNLDISSDDRVDDRVPLLQGHKI